MSAQRTLPPTGTRLIREWRGKTRIVDVIESGFVWEGDAYRSLSVIAKAITGAHVGASDDFARKTRTQGSPTTLISLNSPFIAKSYTQYLPSTFLYFKAACTKFDKLLSAYTTDAQGVLVVF